MTTRLLLLALVAASFAACNAPLPEGRSARPSQPARYYYNPASNSYEWTQEDGRIVTGSYQP